MKLNYIIVVGLLLTSCGPFAIQGEDGAAGKKGEGGTEGVAGPAGSQGVSGQDGSKGDTGETGANGQAGQDGPQGETGAQGAQGEMGPQGPMGAGGSQVTFITPCSGTASAPNLFPEVLMCVSSKLYGVYAVTSTGKIHWAELPPATYQTTDGRNCTFTVSSNCTIL